MNGPPTRGPGIHGRHMDALRLENEARCAVAIRREGTSTVSMLAKLTALSRPTVAGAIARLRERGMVELEPLVAATAGRPARQYRFVGGVAVVAGVNVTSDQIQVIIADLAGTILAQRTHQTGDLRGMGRLTSVENTITGTLTEANMHRSDLASVALAVTGVVGAHQRLVVSHNLPDWEGMDIAGHLQKQFNAPVHLGNDVNLATVAEHRLGAAQLTDDLCYLLLGRQLAAGLVLESRLRRGSHHAAGELGVATLSNKFHFDDRARLVWSSAPDAAATFELATSGDPQAQTEVTRFCEALAETLISISRLIDPECIVLGGWAADLGENLLTPLREALHPYSSSGLQPIVLTSTLGSDSVALGALTLAFDAVAERYYGIADVPLPVLRTADGAAIGKAERITSR